MWRSLKRGNYHEALSRSLRQNDSTIRPDLLAYLQVFGPCFQFRETCFHFLEFGFHLFIGSLHAINLGLEKPEIADPSPVDVAHVRQ